MIALLKKVVCSYYFQGCELLQREVQHVYTKEIGTIAPHQNETLRQQNSHHKEIFLHPR